MVVTTDVELADSYGDWAQAEVTIKVDDKDTSTTWHITKPKTLYTVDIATGATKVEIPKDTVFAIKSNGGTATSKTPFKITDTISYEKQGNDWKEVKKAEVSDINMEFDAVLTDGSWCFKASNIADATATYYKMTFIIDGKTVEVPLQKTEAGFVIWNNFFGAIQKGQGVPVEKLEKAAGSVLQEVDPNTTGWTTAVEGGQSLKAAEALRVQKMNGTWTDVSGISQITVNASFEQMYANQIGVNLTDDANKNLSGFASWSDGSTQIMIDESAVTVQFQLANADWGTVCNTSALTTAITNGSVITIPKQMKMILTDSSDNTKTALLTLDFGAKQTIEKLGNTWAVYKTVHDETTVAHEISDAPYQFTSASSAIIVKKADGTAMDVTVGSTLQAAGVYKVTRIENMGKFVQQLVLYHLGDVHTDDKYTIQDLVAAKKLEQNQTNTDPAGKYAADVNVDGDVDAADIQLLRKSLLSDDPITELKKTVEFRSGQFPIVGFYAPFSDDYVNLVTENVYQAIAEAGINVLTCYANDFSGLPELMYKSLELAEKYGIGVYVNDDHLYKPMESKSYEEKCAYFPKRLGLYSMYESFVGVFLKDEPSAADYPKDGDQLSYYKDHLKILKSYVNMNGYVNFYPYGEKKIDGDYDKPYQDYLDAAVASGVEMLSYDMYPVRYSTVSGKKTYAYNVFYRNLELVSETAEKANVPFWAFAQMGYTDGKHSEGRDKNLLTMDEISWEINAALAFGAKGIEYYPIVQPRDVAVDANGTVPTNYERSGLITYEGSNNIQYYDGVKALNQYVGDVGTILLRAEKKAMIVNDSNASQYLKHVVKIYESEDGKTHLAGVTGANALVGCFDYYGKTVFMVVNCNTETTQDITLNFLEEHQCKVIQQGQDEALSMSVNTLKMNIGAGQSTLVIVE